MSNPTNSYGHHADLIPPPLRDALCPWGTRSEVLAQVKSLLKIAVGLTPVELTLGCLGKYPAPGEAS